VTTSENPNRSDLLDPLCAACVSALRKENSIGTDLESEAMLAVEFQGDGFGWARDQIAEVGY
jgi:hypothetical protein